MRKTAREYVPKEIPLVSIIAELNRETAFRGFNRWLKGKPKGPGLAAPG